MTPAMNSCPTEGRRQPMASRIQRNAAAGRHAIDHHHDRRRDQDAECAGRGDHAGRRNAGQTLLHHCGSMIEPIAITVAGDDPDTAANSAQASRRQAPARRTSDDHRGCKVDHAARDAAVSEKFSRPE